MPAWEEGTARQRRIVRYLNHIRTEPAIRSSAYGLQMYACVSLNPQPVRPCYSRLVQVAKPESTAYSQLSGYCCAWTRAEDSGRELKRARV